MLKSLEDVEKWCHQLTNVIKELYRRLAGRSAAEHRDEWHHNDQRSHNFSRHAVHQMFLPGSQLQTDEIIKIQGRPAGGINEDHSKTYDSWVPRLIYSRVDRTLHLFIIFIYLLGSWISPAVHLHSLACILVTEKMLLTVFLWFLLLSLEEKPKEVKSYDWIIGLLCLLPNRMCSAFGAFSAFILRFDCLLLFCKTSTHLKANM